MRVQYKIAAALVALSMSTPALPQASTASFGQAVANTMRTALGGTGPAGTTLQAVFDAARGVIASSSCSGKNWLCLANLWNVTGAQVSYGDTDGGGASGGWTNEPCPEFAIKFDAAGNLLIPALVSNAGPLNINTAYASLIQQTAVWNDGFSSSTSRSAAGASGLPIATYGFHKLNQYSRSNPGGEYYYGIGYYDAVSGWRGCSPAFYSNTGTYYPSGCAWMPTQTGAVTWGMRTDGTSNSGYKGCPQSNSSGLVSYYASAAGAFCTAYTGSQAAGYGGYALNDEFPVPPADYQSGTFATKYTHMKDCKVKISFIKRMAQELLNRSMSNAPTVDDEDVETGGAQPEVEDLVQNATLPDPQTQGTSPEPEEPSPTPSPTSTSGSPIYDPTVNLPDPASPEIDWWPDLPTIEVDLGNPACPTYPLNVPAPFNWSLTLDGHCPLIEQNRAVIAGIMLLMWSVGAVLIVLRA